MTKARRIIAILLTIVTLLTSMTVKVEAKKQYENRNYTVKENVKFKEICISSSYDEEENQQRVDEMISNIAKLFIAICISLVLIIFVLILNVLIGGEVNDSKDWLV